MNQLMKFGLILGVICLAATLVLAVTYEVTKPKIEEHLKMEEQSALKAIIPSADSFSEKALDGIEYFEALKGKTVIGYCVRVIGNGYNGYIRGIAGVDLNGVIQGVAILEHSETPGLGAKINEIRQGERESWFLRQFKGKNAGTILIKKNIDAVTGATISSKAVTDAIRKTVDDLFTHEPESHACKGVDEWLSVQGSAPPKERNPVKREAAAVRRRSFTKLKK